MSKIGIFMADGCEEIEGLTVVDILRRAGIQIEMISISGKAEVTGSHSITFKCDTLLKDADIASYDGLVLPGGMPGTTNLGNDDTVTSSIKEFASSGKLVAAICAAPSVLGDNGILKGKKATSYPGFEDRLAGAELSEEAVVCDGNIITSRGMGTAIPFALAITSYLIDDKAASDLGSKIMFSQFY